MLGENEGEHGRQDLQDQRLQMMEKDQLLTHAGKTAPGQTTSTGSDEYRRPSRFTDTPSAREMSDKRPGGFQDPPPRSGSSDNRSSFQGYGQAPNPAALAQPGLGDFRGLHDKIQTLYPGSQSSGGAGIEARQAPTSSFLQQSPPGGMPTYARPPPTSVPPAGFGTSGPHWAGAVPLSTSNGRQDWRPGFGGPQGMMPDYYNPAQQQRLPGNWQADAMSFSRFH